MHASFAKVGGTGPVVVGARYFRLRVVAASTRMGLSLCRPFKDRDHFVWRKLFIEPRHRAGPAFIYASWACDWRAAPAHFSLPRTVWTSISTVWAHRAQVARHIWTSAAARATRWRVYIPDSKEVGAEIFSLVHSRSLLSLCGGERESGEGRCSRITCPLARVFFGSVKFVHLGSHVTQPPPMQPKRGLYSVVFRVGRRRHRVRV